MKLKPSIHYDDAVMQIGNSKRFDALAHYLTIGTRKWDIKKTLVYVMPNGLHHPIWLDSKGDYVYYKRGTAQGDYPIIGELEYTNEPVELAYEE